MRRSLPNLPGLPALAVGAVVAAGVVLRFWARSDLWLDEALTVNIARLPLGDIGEALRHDGHPPLYYFLLHAWMKVFGEGDTAVRTLAGVFGVATLPLAWLAGRRYAGRAGGAVALVLLASSPFAVRYATENRMYSLLTLLVLAGWLLVTSAVERPGPFRLAAAAAVSGLLLLTHYWALYLVAAVVVLLAARPERRRVAAAVASGGLLFLPWLPAFWYQAQHTGTPWTRPERPANVVTLSLQDLGGGDYGEAWLLGSALALLVLLALFARPLDGRRMEVDLRTRREARPEALVLGLTIALAVAAGYATGSGFATRYVAAVLPLVLLLAALGATRFADRRVLAAVVGVMVVLGMVGGVRNAVTQRTQGGEIGRHLARAVAPGDLVVFCPDQLGPAVARHLPGAVEATTFPAGGSPDRVDWVDYADRNAAADVEAFAARVLRAAGAHTLWLVWAPDYRTFDEKCGDLNAALGAARPADRVVALAGTFEQAELVRLGPAP